MATDTTSHPRKVLVVEDDTFLQGLIGQGLTKKGYALFIAKDDIEAFAHLDVDIPDVILLDIVLPGLSGFEILEKLKATEKTKGIKVIMLSNLSHQDDIDKAYKLGAAAYLVKSNTSPAEITATIEKVLTE
ncbi:MAG: hypothetical protein K0S38_413 [Candidatus Paceibacter sp.]|nr:hypothetical protein [Candidatus Paceibacter sp.]